jgi:hypothetical protein
MPANCELLWLVECPLFDDQGLVGALMTECKVVLMCDSCGAVWCSPEDIGTDNASFPSSDNDWVTHCGVQVRPGTTHWVDRAEVEKAGWGGLDWKEYND